MIKVIKLKLGQPNEYKFNFREFRSFTKKQPQTPLQWACGFLLTIFLTPYFLGSGTINRHILNAFLL